MAVLTRAIPAFNNGGVDVEVGVGSTGADIRVHGNGDVTVFAGRGSLLDISSRCAAIIAGVNDGDPEEVTIWGGRPDYDTEPEGHLTIAPNSDRTAKLTLTVEGNTADVRMEVDQLEPFGLACAAAGHDL